MKLKAILVITLFAGSATVFPAAAQPAPCNDCYYPPGCEAIDEHYDVCGQGTVWSGGCTEGCKTWAECSIHVDRACLAQEDAEELLEDGDLETLALLVLEGRIDFDEERGRLYTLACVNEETLGQVVLAGAEVEAVTDATQAVREQLLRDGLAAWASPDW